MSSTTEGGSRRSAAPRGKRATAAEGSGGKPGRGRVVEAEAPKAVKRVRAGEGAGEAGAAKPARGKRAAKADPAAAHTRAGARAPRSSDASPSPQRGADEAARPEAAGHALEGLASATLLPARMAANIERIESLTQRLMAALAQKPVHPPAVEGPGPEFFATTSQAWMRMWLEQPARVLQSQTKFWGETLRHYAEAQAELAKGSLTAPEVPTKKDGRFKNPLWEKHPFFAFVRRQYQINAEALTGAVSDLDIEDRATRRRIDWFTRQLIDMMAPTNFLATNPDALERAIETEGESLVKGLENLVADIEAANGEMIVSLVDKTAFKVGENIAASPGSVVARTPMFELIQYAPATDKVRRLPLILFPPWINKFYILDLKPQNSLIKWLVDQGFTLFVVSWKNPGKAQAATSMDDYVRSYIEAMDRVAAITGEPRVNAVGYCIGGTTLHLALAWLKAQGSDRVASATFFTTLTDFSDQGEFTTFLQDDFVGGIEEEVATRGFLGAQLMSRTFSFLRANDLIWGPAIRNYMMGETPPAFDLLYWNADATNLPATMAVDYLRGLCQSNGLVDGSYEVMGVPVSLKDVTVPLCSVACEGDHIAPWLDCWRGFSQTGARDRTFLLSQSGHIAGIINPPGRVKYGHYTSEVGFGGSAQDWREGAAFHEGSWWPTWLDWLAPRAGGMVAARVPDEGLGPAPGTYVHEAADAV